MRKITSKIVKRARALLATISRSLSRTGADLDIVLKPGYIRRSGGILRRQEGTLTRDIFVDEQERAFTSARWRP